MEKSESIAALTAALAKAQAAFQPIIRSSTVDFTTAKGRTMYKYAPLPEVLTACRTALSENGLAVIQLTRIDAERLILETILSHSSGEWIKGEMVVERQPQAPQATGSALTYARRYALSALLGIASEEDDDAMSVALPPSQVQAPRAAPPADSLLCPIEGTPLRLNPWGKWSHPTEDVKPDGKPVYHQFAPEQLTKAQGSSPGEGLVGPEPTSGVASPVERNSIGDDDGMSPEEFRQAREQLGISLADAELALGTKMKTWLAEGRSVRAAWQKVKAAYVGTEVEPPAPDTEGLQEG